MPEGDLDWDKYSRGGLELIESDEPEAKSQSKVQSSNP